MCFLLAVTAALAAAAELALELFHAAGGVDKALLTGKGRVGAAGHIANNDVMLDTVDGFLLTGANSRAADELVARFHVGEHDGLVGRMDVFLHGCKR